MSERKPPFVVGDKVTSLYRADEGDLVREVVAVNWVGEDKCQTGWLVSVPGFRDLDSSWFRAFDGPDYRALWLAALPLLRAAVEDEAEHRRRFNGGLCDCAYCEAVRALPAEARAEIGREG